MNNGSSSRIEADLEAWIAAASPGARLPTTRELTAAHRASPVTVQTALRSLGQRGLIETRPGVGTFVAAVRSARPRDYRWQTAALGAAGPDQVLGSTALRSVPGDVIALHSGYPDRELLPERLVRAALTRAARSDAALQAAAPAGLPDLRAWFAGELAAQTPAHLNPPTAQDVIVLPGSQLGLAALFRSIAGPGATVLIESPSYWGAIMVARQIGITLVPVVTRADGPDLAALDRAFTDTGARAFFAQPNYANPTGIQWSPAVAEGVLDLVRSHEAYLIEDDWAHDLGITTDPVPLAGKDDNGHVIYVRSLTKSVSPAVRVASVIARGPVRQRLLADLQAQSMYVSGLLQHAALDVVTHPGWQTHVRGLRRQLRTRRDLLVEAITTHVPAATIAGLPPGGINLWVQLPEQTDLARLTRDAEVRGLAIAPGDAWFPTEPTGRYLRLSFSGPNAADYHVGAEILNDALAAQQLA